MYANILLPSEVKAVSDYLHREGNIVVLTHGCYDLIHLGHLESLTFARSLALRVGFDGGLPVLLFYHTSLLLRWARTRTKR